MNLYPFQKQAVDEMVRFLMCTETHSVYNACEQGLGKCAMSIEAARRIGAKRILILCPAIMRLVWGEEWNRWMGVDPCTVLDVIMKKSDIDYLDRREAPVSPAVAICSYDLARIPEVLGSLDLEPWDLLILDEAHYLKNTRAKRTKAALRTLWDSATYHILLSGTPFTTRIVDGYSTFHKILPKEFPDFPDFVSRFSYQRVTPFGVEYFGLKNAEALRKIIRSNFYVRYTKEQVLPELPAKTYQRVTLPIQYAVAPKSKSQADQLKVDAEMVRRFLEDGKQPVIPASLAEHRRLQGEAKVDPICEFVADQLENEIPTVVFAYHRKVIADIAQRFGKYNPAVITGDTSSTARSDGIKRFQSGGTCLFVGQFTAAGTGITLTRSSTCVLAELDWSPAVIAQAVDRLHRISQKNAVTIYWFVCENSLDETISNVVMARAQQFKTVLD